MSWKTLFVAKRWNPSALGTETLTLRLGTRSHDVQIRIRRSMLAGVVISLLVHVLALYILSKRNLLDNPPTQPRQTLVVQLALPVLPPRRAQPGTPCRRTGTAAASAPAQG